VTSRTLVVTGANGFVGTHVAEIAAAQGHRVWAVARESGPTQRLAPFCDRYFRADLASTWNVPEGADAIVHLAGLAAVGPSFSDPQRYIAVNSGIMSVMSEALLDADLKPRVVVVSSGAVYSPPVGKQLIGENHGTRPSSPYAVAKLVVETQAAYYAGRGLDTVVARPFNHIGPGQSRGFLVPDLTCALRDLPVGSSMMAGSLSTARDYTDVRDVASAYLLLALAPGHRHHVYNVATGLAHTGSEILEVIAEDLGYEVPHVSIDPARVRPNDPPLIAGDSTRLREEFGWHPQIRWDQSIRDFIEADA
jgi:GDP-4-dehydro-6-deoxy-D-mannose reductase